jgi:hypothetical protein
MESFFWNVLATVVGGCILTFLFFLIREKCFPLPDVNGMWYIKNITKKSAYTPYKGMTLGYTAILWCDGHRISGTSEKTYECSLNGERNFIGTNRCRGVVDGFIQKNYFSNDKIVLHVVEDGFGRESTYSYELTVHEKTKKLEGTFSTMVADQDGSSTWSSELI